MPSKTPKQARFMRAVAHGWKPSRVKAPPVSVAKEFVEADKKSRGGLASMGSVDSGSERQRPLQQLGWEEGGDVDYQVEPGVYEAPNVEEMGPALDQMFSDMEDTRKARQGEVIDYTWDKTQSREAETDLDERLEAMSGPEQVAYVKPRLLAAMQEMKTIGESEKFKRYSIKDYWLSTDQVSLWRGKWTKALQQQAREAKGPMPTEEELNRIGVDDTGNPIMMEEEGMRRGGRMRRNGGGGRGEGASTSINVPQVPTAYSGPRLAGPRAGGRRGGGRRDGGGPRGGGGPGPGGGPGGPSETPPRIIPTDPAAYVGASSDTSGRESVYRDKLREHQNRIDEILGTGNAEGGPVNYYQEGGDVRPGHAEGPNPYNEADPLLRKSYARWEKKHHIDPVQTEEVVEEVPEEEGGGIAAWLRSYFMPDPETANVAKIEEALKREGQAYGGRVRYQTGGLAIAAPAGGVPPWIEPTGIDPGYMDEPQGYQFGGAARGYRGVPPQRRPMQPGGRSPFSRRFQRRQAPGGAPPGGAPQRGGLAAMMQRMQQQRGAYTPGDVTNPGASGFLDRYRPPEQPGFRDPMSGGRGGQYGYEGDPSQPGYDDRSYDAFAAQQRQQGPGITDEVIRSRYEGRNANQGAIFTSGPNPNIGRPGYDPIGDMGPVHPGRGPFRPNKPMPGPGILPGEGIPGGGNIPPWKRPPGGRIAPPPGKDMGGSGPIQGGPRVPPNMQGYLQKMRMQNRPPSGPVGGGGNRVGMQDQQGALARAMQRGTGRAPMSRRMAFGRGAQQ